MLYANGQKDPLFLLDLELAMDAAQFLHPCRFHCALLIEHTYCPRLDPLAPYQLTYSIWHHLIVISCCIISSCSWCIVKPSLLAARLCSCKLFWMKFPLPCCQHPLLTCFSPCKNFLFLFLDNFLLFVGILFLGIQESLVSLSLSLSHTHTHTFKLSSLAC